ncbi:hypothetical protein [Teredinibacter turnerae]|uniref:hypothetical protein n=1 Tax=Teredinibacter turnerae TaxID=2426 RepID=UPI00035C835A|nr:hypothetical protein [Teredinibacter turnerae]
MQKRVRFHLFDGWSRDQKLNAIKKAQSVIASTGEDILKSSSIGIAKNTANIKPAIFEKEIKKDVFWFNYIHILIDATECGVVPKYYIESDGKDGWGRKDFVGLKYTPMFVEISGGNVIERPVFEIKSTKSLTQLADLIAFCAAREAGKICNKESVDITTKDLGQMRWYGFDSQGNPRFASAQGYPWEKFHNVVR